MTGWHVPDAALRGWVDGTVGQVAGASVEQHLAHCERCRASVASLVPAEQVPGSWDSILAVVEEPRRSPALSWLARIGVGQADLAILAATPVLRLGWVLGVSTAIGFALVASLLAVDGGTALFLAVAPLVPVAGVALAYGPTADPSYEAVLTSPYPMMRLMLLRTAAVLATSVPMLLVGGLLLPFAPTASVGWLLPALGCTVVVLTASSWVEPEYAAVLTGLGWVAAVAWAVRQGDALLVLQPVAMAGYAVLLAVGSLVLTRRALRANPSWRL